MERTWKLLEYNLAQILSSQPLNPTQILNQPGWVAVSHGWQRGGNPITQGKPSALPLNLGCC